MRWARGEGGYLWEFPLLVIVAGVVALVVTPLLPRSWQLVPTIVLLVAFVAFLVYNFVCPGWLGGRRRR